MLKHFAYLITFELRFEDNMFDIGWGKSWHEMHEEEVLHELLCQLTFDGVLFHTLCDKNVHELKEPSPIFSIFFTLWEILLSQESSYFSHNFTAENMSGYGNH